MPTLRSPQSHPDYEIPELGLGVFFTVGPQVGCPVLVWDHSQT